MRLMQKRTKLKRVTSWTVQTNLYFTDAFPGLWQNNKHVQYKKTLVYSTIYMVIYIIRKLWDA